MTNRKKGQGGDRQIAQTVIFSDDGFKVKGQFFDPVKEIGRNGSHRLLIKFKNCWPISESGTAEFQRTYNGRVKNIDIEKLIKDIYNEQPKVSTNSKGYADKKQHEEFQKSLLDTYLNIFKTYKSEGWLEDFEELLIDAPQPIRKLFTKPQANRGEFVGELF